MAAYTQYIEQDIQTILAAYDLTYQRHAPIKGGMANTSYCVNSSLVMTALDNHDECSAQLLTRTMRYLNAHDYRTPAPISTVSGKDIFMHQGRPVLLKPYLETTSTPTPELERAEGVGELLGKLHCLPVPAFPSRLGRRIPDNALDVIAGHDCDDLVFVLKLIQSSGFDTLFANYPFALCHGDLMGDNVLEMPGGELVAIDWETLTVDSTILDIGIAAVSAVKRGEPVSAFAQNLLTGYRAAISDATATEQDIQRATAYSCGLMAYHRFVRQNITFPDPTQATIYKQLLPYIKETLDS